MAIDDFNDTPPISGEVSFGVTTDQVLKKNTLTEDSSIREFQTDPFMLRDFETLTDYLGSKEGIGDALIDPGKFMGADDMAEYMRDIENRLGTKINLIRNLDGAPQEVKNALNNLLTNWEKVSPSGVGEWAESIYENVSDYVFNPEMAATVVSGLVTAPAGGTGAIATKAAQVAAKRKATQHLYKMLQGTRAAAEANPYKAVALVSSLHGGADDLLRQDLEITTGLREEVDLGQTAITAGVSGLAGMGIIGGAKTLSKGYKKIRGHTDIPDSKQTAKIKQEEDSENFDKVGQLEFDFDSDVDEKVLNALDTPRLDVDAPEGTQGTLFDDFDVDDPETPVAKVVNKFVDDVGGGERTRRSILSEIRNAANNETTREGARSAIRQTLYKAATSLSSNFQGKMAGVLSPFTAASGTARQLQQKFHHDFGINWRTQEKVVSDDLFETQRKITGLYNEKFRTIVDELSLSNFNTKFADEMNDALSLSLRSLKPIEHAGFDEGTNKAINRAAKEIREMYQDMGTRLKDIGAIDKLVDNYVPRMWSRSAIVKNQEGLIQKLVEKGNMSETQARATVKSMLELENQVDSGGGSGYFFSAKRKLNEIGNDADFEEFLNSDVLSTLHAYTYQFGKQVAKHRVLGVTNFRDFQRFYINRIRKEVQAAGEKFTEKDAQQLEKLYRTQTGEGVKRYGQTAQTAADAYSLTNRVAYLGLATVSSLTEIMLNISKAGVRNSVKGLGQALEMSQKRITKDLEAELMSKHKLTANEAFAEMRKFSIYVDQEMSQLGDRLTGDALMHAGMQNASNKFFRLNLLDQWTRFVQNVSFRSGKNMIQENIEALAKYGDNPLDKRGKALAGELAELGIDYKQGVQWFNNGSKLDDAFYKDSYLGGAARYTNSVILQPTGLAGNKPFLMANPRTSILFQLLSYPAAFSNTVLKGAAKQFTKSPIRNGIGRILPAAFLMTGMARWTNYLRTNGKSEEQDTSDIYYEAIARWGGNGLLLDSVNRARETAKYTNNSAGYLTLPLGPIGADAMSLYQQGIIPTLGNKVPVLSGSYFGKNILGDMDVRRYRTSLKDYQRKLSDAIIPDFEPKADGVGAGRRAYRYGSLVKPARDSLIDIFSTKQEAPEVVEDAFTDSLSDATDNLIKSEKLSEMSRIIEGSYIDSADPDDMLNVDYLADALITHNIRRQDISVEDIEGLPKLKAALNEADLKNAQEKFAYAKQEIASDDKHMQALNTIQEMQEDVDPMSEMSNAIGVATNSLRNVYRRLKIDLTEEELDKVAKADYDEETISELHDFLTSRVKVNRVVGEYVSDEGAKKVARDILFKIAASGDVDLRKFKPPKVQDLNEIPPITAPTEERAKLVENHIKNSVAKTKIYRATKRGGAPAKEFFTSFALPREISSHMGGQGAADNIRMRDILFDNWDAEEAGKLYLLKKNQPTKADTEEVYRNLIDTILKNKNSEFRFDDYVIEEGYLNIENPLVYKSTRAESDTAENVSGTWDVVDLFSTEGGVDELMDNLEDNGIKITKKIATTLDKMQSRAIKIFQMGENTPLEQLKREMMTIELNIDTRQMLKDLGFDGIQYENKIEKGYIDDVDTSYIAFEPQQFKSVDSVGFDSSDPRHKFMSGGKAFGKAIVNFFAPKKTSGLYSEAHKAAMKLEGKKPKPGQSFLNELQNKHQVTPDELEWTGANARFGNNEPTTKEDVQQFFEENDFDFDVNVGRHRPDEIEAIDDMPTLVNEDYDMEFDNWLAENRPFEMEMLNDLLDEEGLNTGAWDDLYNELYDEWQKTTQGVGDFVTQPFHLDYAFEGKDTKNYREVVLTLKNQYKKVGTDFTNPHHPDLKNQVAHIRLADADQLEDAFNKTLLIDEIQSDAHQAAGGKPKNYLTSDKEAELKAEKDKLKAEEERIRNSDMPEDEKEDALDFLLNSREMEAVLGESPIPDLPLKKEKQWGALGLRQAMKIAAEEGYDQVALTTGRLQAIRNQKLIEAKGFRLFKRLDINDEEVFALEGFTTDSFDGPSFLIETFKTPEQLKDRVPKLIGEETTRKLFDSGLDENKFLKIKANRDVKLGGQKYEDFYDKTLMKIWKKEFANKYGVDIKMVAYKQGDKTVKLPTIEITDEMRNDILKGLKMFAEGGYVVSKGDTLSQIAKDNNTTVARLAELNKIEDVNKIFIGQRLELDEPEEENYAAIAEKVVKQEPMSEADVAKAERPVSRKKTVRALKKNLSTPRSSSRTRTQVKETRNGGLFKSQVFKNLATYINPFGGDKTEADYSPEVIEQLKIAARNSIADGRTNIDYADYSKESNVRAQAGMPEQRARDRLLSRAIRGELTPTEEAAFSVGGAQIKIEGDDVFVTDVYDFSKLTDEERTTKERDRYSYLRDFMAKLPGNEFRSKIKIGTRQEFGL